MYKVKRFSVIEKLFGNKENKAKKKAWERSNAKNVKTSKTRFDIIDDLLADLNRIDSKKPITDEDKKLSKFRRDNAKNIDPLMEKMKSKDYDPEIFDLSRKAEANDLKIKKTFKNLEEGRARRAEIFENIRNASDDIKRGIETEVPHIKPDWKTTRVVEDVTPVEVTKKVENTVSKTKDNVSKVGKGLSKNAKIGLGLAAGTAVVGAGAYGIHKYKKSKKNKEAEEFESED